MQLKVSIIFLLSYVTCYQTVSRRRDAATVPCRPDCDFCYNQCRSSIGAGIVVDDPIVSGCYWRDYTNRISSHIARTMTFLRRFVFILSLLVRVPLLLSTLLVYNIGCRTLVQQRRFAGLVCRMIIWLVPLNRFDAFAFGEFIGNIAYLLGIRKQLVTTNLDIAFGSTHSQPERIQLARKLYRYAGLSTADWLHMGRVGRGDWRSLVSFEADAECDAFIADTRQQGTILMGMHTPSLYLASIIDDMVRAEGIACMYALERAQKPLGEALKQIVLRDLALHTLAKQKNGVRQLLTLLKKGHIAYLTPDVDHMHSDTFWPFFGKQASVAPGIYRFAQQQRCPVYMCACYQDSGFNYKVRLRKIYYETSATKEIIKEQIIAGYFSSVEEVVRAYPEQYQQFFARRWRTRPAGETAIFYRK